MNTEVPIEVAPAAREDVRVIPPMTSPIAPTARATRIADMDVLRGFALFGVLMVNLMMAFRVPFWSNPGSQSTGIDLFVSRVQTIVLSNKAMTTFSMLFGVGLSIFLERASSRHSGHPDRPSNAFAMRRLLRRLVVLLGFGLVHALLIWEGDILFSYALVGMVALLFLRRSTKVLLVAIALGFVLPSFVLAWPVTRAIVHPPEDSAEYIEALRIYGGNSYLDIVRFRTHQFVSHEVPGLIFHAPIVLRNFLIGVLIWRSGILRAPLERLRLLRWVALLGIPLGAAFPIYRTIYIALYHPPAVPSAWRMFFFSITVIPFALGYCAGIILFLRRTRWSQWAAAFAPLGRMAFTNYLTQSLVFTTVFYGYGFGLLGKLGEAKTALMGIVFLRCRASSARYGCATFNSAPSNGPGAP